MAHTAQTVAFDYIIAGAGASGLFLALEMLDKGLLANHKLAIVEQHAQKGNDRTWCFWTNLELPPLIASMVSHSWDSCISEGKLQNLGPYQYYHVRGADFYAEAWRKLSSCPQVSVITGHIKSLQPQQNMVAVQVGTVAIYAPIVFNSIPKFNWASPPYIPLWQSFFGWRIRFLSPPTKALNLTLMDFEVPQERFTQFVYVLPFDGHRALVEVTRFGNQKMDAETGKAILSVYLQPFGAEYEIEEVEMNQIPMTQLFDADAPNHQKTTGIVAIGSAAGALKPTSGYAFLKMHAHAAGLVAALQNDAALPTIFRNKRFRFYDALLLQILTATPEKGNPIFKQLFSKVPTPLVLKFLDEQTTPMEEVRIFRKMPIFLFLKNLWTYSFKK